MQDKQVEVGHRRDGLDDLSQANEAATERRPRHVVGDQERPHGSSAAAGAPHCDPRLAGRVECASVRGLTFFRSRRPESHRTVPVPSHSDGPCVVKGGICDPFGRSGARRDDHQRTPAHPGLGDNGGTTN